MSTTLGHAPKADLLNSIRKPAPAKAKLDVNEVHASSRLLRVAVARTGMNHQEAMDALGIAHKSEFSEMLDGKRKIWMHQLLRPTALAIWKELIFVSALAIPGMSVERTLVLKVSA